MQHAKLRQAKVLGDERADSRTDVAPDREERLRKTMPAAGRHSRNAGCFRMEYGRPQLDQPGSQHGWRKVCAVFR